MMQSCDLHVRNFVRMRGGVIYRDSPPITDIIGFVPASIMPNGKRLYLLEPGLYMVYFEEVPPVSFDGNTYFHVKQYELNLIGGLLNINTSPFGGSLQVHYPMQIEENSKLAILMYNTVPNPVVVGEGEV